MPSFSVFQERMQSFMAWRSVQGVAVAVALLGVAAAAHRAHHQRHIPGPFDPELKLNGFIDFQNGIFFPSQAFARGVSPYSAEYAEDYPVPRPTPAYSPLTFAYHVPFTWLPLQAAEWVYFVLIVSLAIGFLWLLLKDADMPVGVWLWPLLALLVWSRAGHATLFGGYFTLELALGMVAALHFARTKPWLAAFGLAVTSVKPTYFIPLVILMFARGDYRATIRGTILSIVGAVASAAWLMHGSGITGFFQDIQSAQTIHRTDTFETPANTWTRIDLAAVVGKWFDWNPPGTHLLLFMLVLLAVPAALLWRNRRESSGATSPSGSLICVASLAALYHQMYDAMLVFPAVIGLLLSRQDVWKNVSPIIRVAAAGCVIIPLYNITSTRFFIERFAPSEHGHQLLTSVNGVAIGAGMILSCFAAMQRERSA